MNVFIMDFSYTNKRNYQDFIVGSICFFILIYNYEKNVPAWTY